MAFLILIFFAIITAAVAQSKGYHTAACFFLGLFFGFIPLIVLIFLPNKKEEEEKRCAADLRARQQEREIAELKSRLRRLEESQPKEKE